MNVGKKIAVFRKQKGWTQAELGERLGVSNQAVSKWESGATLPDILLLPALADVFGCTVDALFSRESCASASAFPWPDDDTLRVFQAQGHRILQKQEGEGAIEVILPRNCNETTRQYFRVEVFGNMVSEGSINGDVVCHGNLDCPSINGDVTAQGNISACQITAPGKCICGSLSKKE